MPSRIDAIFAALGGSIALAAAVGIGRFVYTPILPPMADALGLSKSIAGLIASANFLGYLAGALAAALPNLPGSRRVWVLGALIVSALTTGAMGMSQHTSVFLMLRFAGGVASAFSLVMASVIVLEKLAETRHAALSSLHFAGVGLGIAISAALVSTMSIFGFSWQSLWLASGGISVVAAFAAYLLLRGPNNFAASPSAAKSATQTNNRKLFRLIVAYGLVGFGYVITATFLVVIVRSAPTIRQLESVIWIVFGLAAVLSSALWTRAGVMLGVPKAFALACLMEAAGVIVSVIWQNILGVFLAAIFVGGTFVSLMALGMVRAHTLTAGDSRRVVAWMTSAFGLGQIVGPVFAGALADRLGTFVIPSIVAATALLVAAILGGS